MDATGRDSCTRTKIIATLGPASWDEPILSELISAGVDCFRINCSHADAKGIRMQVARVRRAAMVAGAPMSILLDLQGPKIRVGKVEAPLNLRDGDTLTIVMQDALQPVVDGEHRIGTTFPGLVDEVNVGDTMLFADGALSGTVTAKRPGEPGEVDVLMDVGGSLSSNKGINLPGVAMQVPALTDKDIADLEVGLDVGVDYVALSFVRSATDVITLRQHLDARSQDVPIIAKIEKPQAVEALEGILEVAEGVMVARGDLGVEVQLEKVPVYQKRIIDAARRRGRLVITATQMLDSMERNPRPTRAETTDVANAILDGTDVIMLSGETAIGQYPVRTVRTMDNIAWEVERSPFFRAADMSGIPGPEPAWTVIRAACHAARSGDRPMVVFTWSGAAALAVSKARIPVPIFALTPQQRVIDRLALVWGVTPLLVPLVQSTDELIAAGEAALLKGGHVPPGQQVVLLAGSVRVHGETDLMKVFAVGT